MASSNRNSNCDFYNIHEKRCGFSSLSKAKDNVLLETLRLTFFLVPANDKRRLEVCGSTFDIFKI